MSGERNGEQQELHETRYPALLPGFDPRHLPGDGFPVYPQLWADVPAPAALFAATPEELIELSIRPAERTSRTEPLPGGIGGPFGSLCAIPEQLVAPESGAVVTFRDWYPRLAAPHAVTLAFAAVRQWRVIAFGTNLVHPLGNPLLHAECVAQGYASRAVGGRNFWKRFVLIATTGAPCGMCAASFKWSMPRWVVSGDAIAGAMQVGFHEAQPHDCAPSSASAAHTDSWVEDLRRSGIEVQTGVSSALVEERLYRPYRGVVYNSGPTDPTG